MDHTYRSTQSQLKQMMHACYHNRHKEDVVVNRQDLLVGVPEAQDVVAVIVLTIFILRGIERRTDVRVGVDLSHDSSVSFIGIADTLRRQVHL